MSVVLFALGTGIKLIRKWLNGSGAVLHHCGNSSRLIRGISTDDHLLLRYCDATQCKASGAKIINNNWSVFLKLLLWGTGVNHSGREDRESFSPKPAEQKFRPRNKPGTFLLWTLTLKRKSREFSPSTIVWELQKSKELPESNLNAEIFNTGN